jgi:hypothetical protein
VRRTPQAAQRSIRDDTGATQDGQRNVATAISSVRPATTASLAAGRRGHSRAPAQPG